MQNVSLWTLGLLVPALASLSSGTPDCDWLFAVVLFLLCCGVPAKPDLAWSPDFSEGWSTFVLCGSTKSAHRRVYLLLLCACVRACVFSQIWQQNCHLFFYSSLPLRKLLQCLWMLCNEECACVCVDAGLWQIHHLNNSSSSGCFFPLYLLFAAWSRSVSGVKTLMNVVTVRFSGHR